ncbi:MAG: iron-sulfur cluster assembly protein [Planctomycetota bacterium]
MNIHELGLVYELRVDEQAGAVDIVMTLTSPSCPVAESLPPEVQRAVQDVPGVRRVQVEVTWEPPWGLERMSEAARLQLGLE